MRNLPKEIPDREIQPWHHLGGIEHICELRKSCIVLYGIFTEIARLVYHDPTGRLTGTPSVIWKKGKTDIWIDSELRWEDEHPEVRPAIYIQLGPLQSTSVINGMNGRTSPADRFGVRHYDHIVSGQVTFMHVASTAGEACALADNTDYALTMMQDPICNDFCFRGFAAAGRTALEKLPAEASDKYASGVTFAYEFEDSWDVKEECPILKSIDVIDKSDDTTNYNGHDTVNRANIFTEKKVSGSTR